MSCVKNVVKTFVDRFVWLLEAKKASEVILWATEKFHYFPTPLRKIFTFSPTRRVKFSNFSITADIFGKRSKPKPTFRQYFLRSPAIGAFRFSLVPLFARLTLKSQRLEICSAFSLLISKPKAVQRGSKNFLLPKIFYICKE